MTLEARLARVERKFSDYVKEHCLYAMTEDGLDRRLLKPEHLYEVDKLLKKYHSFRKRIGERSFSELAINTIRNIDRKADEV